jgi:hypothetical protein
VDKSESTADIARCLACEKGFGIKQRRALSNKLYKQPESGVAHYQVRWVRKSHRELYIPLYPGV